MGWQGVCIKNEKFGWRYLWMSLRHYWYLSNRSKFKGKLSKLWFVCMPCCLACIKESIQNEKKIWFFFLKVESNYKIGIKILLFFVFMFIAKCKCLQPTLMHIRKKNTKHTNWNSSLECSLLSNVQCNNNIIQALLAMYRHCNQENEKNK